MLPLHESLFDLLIEIDQICQENDIQYFLAGGSALGALRNNCFLPWDDDIDLYITRDNWNKLRDLVEQKPEILPPYRTFVYKENTRYHRNPIVRYVKANTTVIYAAQAFSGMTCGQQLEFFILDPIPAEEAEKQAHLETQRAYLELLSPYFVVCKNMNVTEFKDHLARYERYYQEGRSRGVETVLKELADKVETYDDALCDTYCLRWGIRTLLHKKEYYQGSRKILLEGREFPVAPQLEKALRVDYGDSWMYIPSGAGQITHNPIVEDLDRPFKDYTDIYLPKIDRESLIEEYTKNKHTNMELYCTRREIEMEEAKLRSIIAEHDFRKTLEPQKEELKELLEQEDYRALNRMLAKYTSLQMSKNFRRYGVRINLDPEIIYIAIMSWIRQGLYYRASGLMNLQKDSEGNLPEGLLVCQEMIEMCRAFSVAIYDNDDPETVEALLEQYKDNAEAEKVIDYHRAYLWSLQKKADCFAVWKKIFDYSTAACERYPFDGELLEYLAVSTIRVGWLPRGREIYKKAADKTRNGFVWKRCKKVTGYDRMARE